MYADTDIFEISNLVQFRLSVHLWFKQKSTNFNIAESMPVKCVLFVTHAFTIFDIHVIVCYFCPLSMHKSTPRIKYMYVHLYTAFMKHMLYIWLTMTKCIRL